MTTCVGSLGWWVFGVGVRGLWHFRFFANCFFVGLVRFQHLKSQLRREISVDWMSDDAVQDVKAHVDGVVSAKMDGLYEHISGLLSRYAKEADVKEESDALKTLLFGIEVRFREEHGALVEKINAHTVVTKDQTSLLDALFNEAKTSNEKVDRLCTHATRLEKIAGDVATISNAVQGVENKTEAIPSFSRV